MVTETRNATDGVVGGDPPTWECLAAEWAKVRNRASRLRALADELDEAAEEWEAVIRERRATLP